MVKVVTHICYSNTCITHISLTVQRNWMKFGVELVLYISSLSPTVELSVPFSFGATEHFIPKIYPPIEMYCGLVIFKYPQLPTRICYEAKTSTIQFPSLLSFYCLFLRGTFFRLSKKIFFQLERIDNFLYTFQASFSAVVQSNSFKLQSSVNLNGMYNISKVEVRTIQGY